MATRKLTHYSDLRAMIAGEFFAEELRRQLVASIPEVAPNNAAIKNAVQNQITVPGAEVYRGDHLRVA